MSLKAAENRAMVKIVGDGFNLPNQLSVLLKEKVSLRVFVDLHLLLESIVKDRWRRNR